MENLSDLLADYIMSDDSDYFDPWESSDFWDRVGELEMEEEGEYDQHL